MNCSKPRVSIGMPVYNGDRFLSEALDAILAQTYEDFELVISDNASTDRTQEICKEYATKDRRVKYYRNEKNIGGHRNFNRVFQLATGEYFRWATHDDLCASKCLERCVEVLEQNPDVVLCYTKTKLIDEHGTILDRNYDENPLLTHSPQPHVRFRNLIIDSFSRPYRGQQLYGVMRINAAATTPLLEDYSGADLVFLARMALLGQFREVPEYLFFNRDHVQRASGGAMSSPYLRMKWFDPNVKEGKPVFPRWSVFLGYLNSIKSVPLSSYQQMRCYFHMRTWLSKNWEQLVKELLKAAIWPYLFSYPSPDVSTKTPNWDSVRLILKRQALCVPLLLLFTNLPMMTDISESLRSRLLQVKFLALDVDGVLTDGGLYFTEIGEVLQKFNIRDGQGIKLLMRAGIEVAIITANPYLSTIHYVRHLGIKYAYLGVEDKLSTLRDLCRKFGLSLSQVAYITHDSNDFEVIQAVGCPLTVADAMSANQAYASYVTKLSGGQGAVREICDLLMQVQLGSKSSPSDVASNSRRARSKPSQALLVERDPGTKRKRLASAG